MAAHHDRMRALIAGGASTGRRPTWSHVMANMGAIRQDRSADSVAVLRDLARFRGTFDVDDSHGLTHALPPEEVTRMVAVQTLADWDLEAHRDVIQEVMDQAEFEQVAAVARGALGG